MGSETVVAGSLTAGSFCIGPSGVVVAVWSGMGMNGLTLIVRCDIALSQWGGVVGIAGVHEEVMV
jgi:hypothetical protein